MAVLVAPIIPLETSEGIENFSSKSLTSCFLVGSSFFVEDEVLGFAT